MGLIKRERGKPRRLANSIYQEIIPRELTWSTQDGLIRKPLTDHYGGPIQRVVLELKIKRGNIDTIIKDGLRQTWQYMDTVGSVDEGHLIIFDRTQEKPWEERIWHRQCEYEGHPIMVWGM